MVSYTDSLLLHVCVNAPELSNSSMSAWEDSNLRLPGPKPGTLTKLRYRLYFTLRWECSNFRCCTTCKGSHTRRRKKTLHDSKRLEENQNDKDSNKETSNIRSTHTHPQPNYQSFDIRFRLGVCQPRGPQLLTCQESGHGPCSGSGIRTHDRRPMKPLRYRTAPSRSVILS